MKEGAVFVYLTVCAVWDLKKRSLPVWLLLLGSLGALLYEAAAGFVLGASVWAGALSGSLVGLALLAAGRIAPGSIGSGDGWCFFNLGLLLGLQETLGLLWVTMMAALIFSGVLLLFRKANRKTRLPLVPFIWTGFLVMRLVPVLSG